MAKKKPIEKAEKAAKALGGMSGKAAKGIMARRRRMDALLRSTLGAQRNAQTTDSNNK